MNAKKPAPRKSLKGLTQPLASLPPDVLPADLKMVKWDDKARFTYEKDRETLTTLGEVAHTGLHFYEIAERSRDGKKARWVLCTLHISNPSRRHASGTAARTYAINVDDEKVCRVGMGPHVLREITVHLNRDNLARLTRYVDLLKKGLADAGMIRDRISTRRAQGQLHRAAGRSSWIW